MSDINFTQAAEDARTLARQFKSVLNLADFLEQVGSVDTHLKELEAARARTAKAFVEDQQLLTRLLDEVEQARASRLAEEQTAEGVIRNAHIAEQALLAKAREDAENIVSNAKAAVQGKKAALAEVEGALEAKQAELAAAQQSIATAEETLATIRASVARMLG
jgi:ATP-dependent Clp protease ATP-binding subunit ClpA